jgi:hypothetical protein
MPIMKSELRIPPLLLFEDVLFDELAILLLESPLTRFVFDFPLEDIIVSDFRGVYDENISKILPTVGFAEIQIPYSEQRISIEPFLPKTHDQLPCRRVHMLTPRLRYVLATEKISKFQHYKPTIRFSKVSPKTWYSQEVS